MGSKNMRKYLSLAMDVAKDSKHHSPTGYTMGCVIVRNGKVIATGTNEPFNAIAHRVYTRHQNMFEKDYHSLHAEIKAISLTDPEMLKRSWVFVNGYNAKSGNELVCSRPCPNCGAMLEYLGIRAVCWVQDGKVNVEYMR